MELLSPEIIQSFFLRVRDWTMTSGLRVLFILIGGFAAWVGVRFVISRLSKAWEDSSEDAEHKKRITTLTGVVRTLAATVLGLVVLLMILGQLGVDMAPIIAAAGIGGLAIGFGAQALVKDVITGFFILLENQVRVGDVVQIQGQGGLVESTGLRVLTIRDFAGNVHIFPNGSIDKVTNMTKDYSRYVFDIGVAYREDVDEVIQVMKDVAAEMEKDPVFGAKILQPLEVFGLDSFGDSALVIKARFTTKPIEQWNVGREYNRRLKKAFDEKNIEIPFPHQTLYFGEDKDGTAPPAHLKMLEPAQ